MTALEALYNKFIASHEIKKFYDTFKFDCPHTFFEELKCLCDMEEYDECEPCCKCWLQEVINERTE